MYINFQILDRRKLEVDDLIILQLVKQNKNENLEKRIGKYPQTRIDFLESLGYLNYIKGKKKDSKLSKLRITKQGKKVLDDIETPEVLDEDIVLFEWLEKIYKKLDKDIGNKKKTKMYIALFRTNSGIEKNCLAILLEDFVNNEDNMEWNQKLEYAFFKPTNLYQTKFQLDESRLYKYYLSKKDFFDNIFKKHED